MRVLLIVLALVSLASCSSCTSKNKGESVDTGQDSSSDADTDADSDGDSDSDIDTDTGMVSDAGPWDWEDQPDAGDCDPPCKQVTFSDEVRVEEWDIWDNYLVYNDPDTVSFIVDLLQQKQMQIPNVHPEHPLGIIGGSSTYYPAVANGIVYHTQMSYFSSPIYSEIIRTDIDSKEQWVIFHYEEQSGEYPDPAKYIDVNDQHLVSSSGCGGFDSEDLCHFLLPPPTTPEMIFQGGFGNHTNISGDIVVWTLAFSGNDIQGYNLATEQFIDVTDDDDAEYQLAGRIFGNKVVYMDMRFGDSDPMGNWNHSAIFMHDIVTGVTTQITSGEWVAAYPDIYENIIIWADYRDSSNPNDKNSLSGVQIWGYNIDTSTEFQITNVPDRAKTTPRIWENNVFVAMYKADGGDAIYMFPLPDGAK